MFSNDQPYVTATRRNLQFLHPADTFEGEIPKEIPEQLDLVSTRAREAKYPNDDGICFACELNYKDRTINFYHKQYLIFPDVRKTSAYTWQLVLNYYFVPELPTHLRI